MIKPGIPTTLEDRDQPADKTNNYQNKTDGKPDSVFYHLLNDNQVIVQSLIIYFRTFI